MEAFEPIIFEDILQSDTAILNLFKRKRPDKKDFQRVFGMSFQDLSQNLIDVINKKHSSAFEMLGVTGVDTIND
jgi:hypothetical protein